MLRDDRGMELPRLPARALTDITNIRNGIGVRDSSAIDDEIGARIRELVRTRMCRNLHDNHGLPVIALGLIWGDPTTDVKSWEGTALQALYEELARRLAPSDAMYQAKLLAGVWLRLRVETSRYWLRSY